MDLLAANMGSIANFSEQISATLHVIKFKIRELKVFNYLLRFSGYQAEINAVVVSAFNVEKAAISVSSTPHIEEKPGRRQLR